MASCDGVQCAWSTSIQSGRTMLTALISSRCWRESGVAGFGVSQNICIEANLVRGMAGQHRPAARLRDIADEDALPAGGGGGFAGEALQQRDEVRMAPVAVAREAHHLPALAIDRERLCAGKAALGKGADGARFERGRARHATEKAFRGIVRQGFEQSCALLRFPRSASPAQAWGSMKEA